MSTTKRSWLDWLPLIGMIITIAGVIFAVAQYASRIDDDTRRIGALETKQDATQQLDVRLARIEATLEMMNNRAREK